MRKFAKRGNMFTQAFVSSILDKVNTLLNKHTENDII